MKARIAFFLLLLLKLDVELYQRLPMGSNESKVVSEFLFLPTNSHCAADTTLEDQ